MYFFFFFCYPYKTLHTITSNVEKIVSHKSFMDRKKSTLYTFPTPGNNDSYICYLIYFLFHLFIYFLDIYTLNITQALMVCTIIFIYPHIKSKIMSLIIFNSQFTLKFIFHHFLSYFF